MEIAVRGIRRRLTRTIKYAICWEYHTFLRLVSHENRRAVRDRVADVFPFVKKHNVVVGTRGTVILKRSFYISGHG
jgi:hypothetical protein